MGTSELIAKLSQPTLHAETFSLPPGSPMEQEGMMGEEAKKEGSGRLLGLPLHNLGVETEETTVPILASIWPRPTLEAYLRYYLPGGLGPDLSPLSQFP